MLNDERDAAYMAAAISLSQRGRGQTNGNPNVGCIIVKDGSIVGRGWTQPGGRPHAEAMALEQAGKKAIGSDIYVTLEPCAHESARGSACCELVVAAKPSRIIVASLDPDARTHRKGIDRLGEAGISVSVGLLEKEAQRTMAGFFTRTDKNRPHIILKLAMSLDGCIAMGDSSSQWITGARARAHTHLLRSRSDAILVGSGTVRNDQPTLDVRLDGLADRSPMPIVLGTAEVPDNWQTLSVPSAVADLENVNWLLIEGGAGAGAAFLAAKLVDQLHIYRAPIIIGGGRPSINDLGLQSLNDAHGQWQRTDRRPLGKDILEIYDRAA